MRRKTTSRNKPTDPNVFRSSTFRLALAFGLLAWLLMLAGIWSSRQLEPVEPTDQLRREVEQAAFDVPVEIVAIDWERREEPEEDSEGEEHFEPFFDASAWNHARLSALLQEAEGVRDWLSEEKGCWQLLSSDGTWLDGNLWTKATSIPGGPSVVSRVQSPLLEIVGIEVDGTPPERFGRDVEPDGERSHCLVQEVRLGDGTRFQVGRTYQPLHLQPALATTVALVLLSLAAALGGSFVLARRTVRFVGDLRRARSRLVGEVFPRLRQPGDGGDFDRAAREINEILDALESALGSLTHVTDNIAHDLRTPLTRLQGQLDILRRSGDPTETMIIAVQEEADQLVATFNALLRIAQVESGHRKRGFRSFDLARVVSDLGDLYAPAFAERNMPFVYRVPGSLVPSTGDPDLWMQALSNLLDNALKYNAEGGAVDLELEEGPPPRLILRDHGPGIPRGERERVFERFYRVERNRSQARVAGLGLSLVAAVCALHGTTIQLEGDDGLLVRIVWSPSIG